MVYRYNRSLLFVLLFTLSLTCQRYVAMAQAVPGLNMVQVPVKGIVKPWYLLPDSLKTYVVNPYIAIDSRWSGIDAATIRTEFSLPNLEYKTEKPDVIVSVWLNKTAVNTEEKGQRDNVFWYREKIRINLAVKIAKTSGQVLYEGQQQLSYDFDTPARKSLAEAKPDYINRQNDQTYLNAMADACRQVVQWAMTDMDNTFSAQDETIGLYIPRRSNARERQQLKAMEAALQKLNDTLSVTAVAYALRPMLDTLEQLAAANQPDTDKQRYIATLLTLVNVYRCLDQYDKATHYARLLVQTKTEQAKNTIKRLAAMRERYQQYTYSQKTGRRYDKAQAEAAKVRLQAVKNIARARGFLVMANGDTVKGTVLDPFQHFQAGRVRLKYEKKLNAPVADVEYSLDDVQEIRAEGANLAIVRQGGSFYLCEVAFQQPRIMVCRTFPGQGPKAGLLNKEDLSMAFIKKTGDTEFLPVNDVTYDCPRYLYDCPSVALQAEYGYYTVGQLHELAQAYQDSCGQNPKKARPGGRTIATKDAKRSTVSKVFVGVHGGHNNFTSVLGVSATLRIRQQWYTRIGFGTGWWGLKYAAGMEYDFRPDLGQRQGWSLAMGYSYHPGRRESIDLQYNIDATDPPVTIRPLAAHTLRLTALKNIRVGKNTIVPIELGYAFPLNQQPWILDLRQDTPAARRVVRFAAPGGVVLGVGINVGIRN